MRVIFDGVHLVRKAVGHKNACGPHDTKLPDMKHSSVTARNVLIVGAFIC